MRMLRLLYAAQVTLSAVAAENDSKAIFAKHWQIGAERAVGGLGSLLEQAS